MAKTKISEFSATANSNTDINSINIAEGCAPSNINDAIRELMAELKDFQAGTKGDSFNGPVGSTTAAAGAFTTLSSTGNTTLGDASGDTVTINGTATFANANPTLSAGTANGVLYLNGSKVATSGSALTFDGTNLGVGIASPVAKLDLGTTVSKDVLLLYSGGSGSQYGFGISGALLELYTSSSGSFSFNQRTGASYSELMRLTSTGLGIGTSSPGTRLEVGGEASPIFRMTSTSGPYSQIQSNTVGTLQFMADEGNTGASTSMRFRIDGAEVARFDSSGNLGLGVTPSASAGAKAINIGSIGYVFGDGSIYKYNAGITSNAYVNGNGTFAAIQSRPAGVFEIDDGVFKWRQASSGTAGSTLSLTQALTLNTNGALVLQGGNTSASGVGVAFPATQSASSDANTLDDYEEGTASVTYAPESSGTITVDTNNDIVAYTKIGRQVTITGQVQISSVSSPSGNYVHVNNLPFASADLTEASGRIGGAVTFYDASANSYTAKGVLMLEGGTQARLYIDASTVAASDGFIFSFSYFTT